MFAVVNGPPVLFGRRDLRIPDLIISRVHAQVQAFQRLDGDVFLIIKNLALNYMNIFFASSGQIRSIRNCETAELSASDKVFMCG